MTVRNAWRSGLASDPIPGLLAAGQPAIAYFTRRDLLDETVEPVDTLWELSEVARLVRKQQPDGSWRYPSKQVGPDEDYAQLETFRNLGLLVEKYGLSRRHPAIERAAMFLFSRQTQEGDFRGIYSSQYAPNYSAAIMEILIKAGYEDDPRIERGLDWLLTIRQDDGGWASPVRTAGIPWAEAVQSPEPIAPVRSRPFSHLFTGMVLRSFAAHPVRRRSPEARQAGLLLASRLFKADKYLDRREPLYWEKLTFPFWFPDVVSALDSLSLLGLPATEPPIREALDWLCARQQPDGQFTPKLLKGGRDPHQSWWVCLAICRVFRRFAEQGDSAW